MIKGLGAALAVLAILATGIANAHEHRMPEIPAGDLADIQAELVGSVTFARGLAEHWQGFVPNEQLPRIGKISDLLHWLDERERGRSPDTDIRKTAWLKWRVGEEVRVLAENWPGIQFLDFSANKVVESPELTLDPQVGCILLKVIQGPGPVEFVNHTVDFTSERHPTNYTVPVAASGTTIVLLRLEQIPESRPTAVRIAFQPRGAPAPSMWWMLRFKTQGYGNLGININNEDDEPVPAMVRLTAKSTGKLWEPAGAVDFRPMMNDVTNLPIYGPGRGYMMWIPEPWRGHYWVMPGPFEMALPSGEWILHVWRGLEHAPQRIEFEIKAGEWLRRTIRIQRWIDMGKRGWFSGDDHVHARVMSGEDADKLMAWTRAADLGVCNVLEMGDEARSWYSQRGFGKDFRVNVGDHWIIPGQEDPRGVLGHAIGLNLASRVRAPERYLDHRHVAETIHQQGGLYGHTHVGAKALFVERQMALYTPFGLVDFNSVMQSALNTELMFHYLNLGYRMTASAGTDTPYGGVPGAVRVYACADGGRLDPDKWFDAMRAGKTFVTTGPMVDFQVDGQLPGSEIEVRRDQRVKVTIKAEGLAGKSSPKTVRLVRFGKVIKEVHAEASGAGVLSLDHEVDSGFGCWLAAHVFGEDGSEALTTPVYLKRDGFRFWDIENAEALLAEQMAVLRQIETMLEESKMIAASRSMDHTLRAVVQGERTLRDDIAKAKSHYEDLVALVKRERQARDSNVK